MADRKQRKEFQIHRNMVWLSNKRRNFKNKNEPTQQVCRHGNAMFTTRTKTRRAQGTKAHTTKPKTESVTWTYHAGKLRNWKGQTTSKYFELAVPQLTNQSNTKYENERPQPNNKHTLQDQRFECPCRIICISKCELYIQTCKLQKCTWTNKHKSINLTYHQHSHRQ